MDPRPDAHGTGSRAVSRAVTRLLLIEDLDALGADLVDCQHKAEWLEARGAKVTWRAVARAGDPAPGADAGRKARHLVTREGAAEELRALAAREDWDSVLLASAFQGGGPLARWLPGGARWWPTGLPGPSAVFHPLARLARRVAPEAELAPIEGLGGSGESWLAGAAVNGRPSQAGLPLWDGEIVLAPEGLGGRAGMETLSAFAAMTEDWSGVDLVAWSHPAAEVVQRARALGAEMRVHQVGPPPRPAEWAWWGQASAALLSGEGRLSIGVVLRALASGCPLLWVAPRGAAGALAAWMNQRGCARVVAAEPAAVADGLAALLEREDAVEAMIERGRAVAAQHDPHALIARVAPALSVARPTRRAA